MFEDGSRAFEESLRILASSAGDLGLDLKRKLMIESKQPVVDAPVELLHPKQARWLVNLLLEATVFEK